MKIAPINRKFNINKPIDKNLGLNQEFYRSSASSDIYFRGDNSLRAAKANKIWGLVENSDNILILTHKFADADGISSGLVLSNIIKEQFPSKNVEFYVPNGYPSYLKELPGIENIKTDEIDFKKIGLAISVDSSEQSMDGLDLYKKAEKYLILDHHYSVKMPNDLSIIDKYSASATDVLYNQLIKPLNIKITPNTAECLLTGLLSDTNFFKYRGSADSAIRTKNELLKFCNDDKIEVKIRQKFEKNGQMSAELKDLQRTLVKNAEINKLKTHNGRSVNFVIVTQDLLRRFKIQDSKPDINNALNFVVKSIKQSDASILFWELTEGAGIKIEMRSRDGINLQKFAQMYNGGGHPNAVGFTIKGSIKDVSNDVLTQLKRYRF